MLLRMLSACAPHIGYWINPTACSGQDQDPSNETIVATANMSTDLGSPLGTPQGASQATPYPRIQGSFSGFWGCVSLDLGLKFLIDD